MKKPLRLMLWHWGRHGGGPSYTYHLARALKALPNIETHLSISRQCEIAEEFRALDLPVLWVDTYRGLPTCLLQSCLLPAVAWRLRRYIHDHRIDVIDSTMTHLWTRLVTPALGRHRARLVCTVHDATLHPGEGGRIKDWFYAPVPGVDAYIALTRFVADRLVDVYGIARDRITVIPHGVITFPSPPPMEPRREGGPLRLLFLGRIQPYKGLDLLIGAYKQLLAEGHAATLTIAGFGELGDLRGKIETLPGISLNNRWIPHGEMAGLLGAADVVVLPYVEASQSGVLPAAFAAGLTAVVNPVGGLGEQVDHQVNGLVTEGVSQTALFGQLRRLAGDGVLLSRLKEGALRTAREELSWERIAGSVVRTVGGLLADDEAGRR